MRELIRIMTAADGWVDVWWMNDRYAGRVLHRAQQLGMVARPSTSQVYWTERGAELARKYAPDLFR